MCRVKNKIIVGTKHSSIYEIEEKTSTIQKLVMGHSEGELWGLATHPSKEVYVTASYDGFIKVWDIKTKKSVCQINANTKMRCIDFSPDGAYIAIGCKEGEIFLYRVSKNFDKIEKIDSNRQRKACITDLKFSPSLEQGTTILAAGSADCAIDFMEVTNDGKLTRIGYCKQVPGPVSVFDFSSQGEYIKVSTANHKKIIYSVPMGNEIKPEVIQDKVEWNNWTR